MKDFLIKILLFLLPVILMAVFPVLVALYGREVVPVNRLIAAQTEDRNARVGLAYSDVTMVYKLESARSHQPEIVVLGSSRVMQFRSEFFTDPSLFYNGGGYAHAIGDFVDFLKNLGPDNRIKTIIIGIDENMLNPAKPPQTLHDKFTQYDSLKSWIRGNWRLSYLDYFKGKFTLQKLREANKKSNNLGLGALITNTGFRADGSLARAVIDESQRLAALKAKISESVASIEPDAGGFEYGPVLSTPGLQALEEFLREAKRQHIHVIGYLSPYAHEIYERMASLHDSYHDTFTEMPKVVGDMFSRYHDSFYDFTDLTTLGSPTEELIDPTHGSERTCVRMLIEMAKSDPELKKYIDSAHLQELLQTSPSHTTVISDNF